MKKDKKQKQIFFQRGRYLFYIFLALSLGLIFRLGYIQLALGEELRAKALSIREEEVPLLAKRGDIYDRQGEKMALSHTTASVAVFPGVINEEDKDDVALKLAGTLELPVEEIKEKLESKNNFCYIKRRLDLETADRVRGLKLKGVTVTEEESRFYPQGAMAAHVLGFAGVDNKGLEGVEYYYDDWLSGKEGSMLVEFDAVGNEIPFTARVKKEAEAGNNLILTIDLGLQLIVEEVLNEVMQSEINPKSATVILMNPQNGEILALANNPNYDINEFLNNPPAQYPSSLKNIAISNIYEPGSTFKSFTSAAALEEKVVKPEDHFYDPGYITVGKTKIRCWRSYNPHGEQTFAEGIQNSCNPVFVETIFRLEDKEKGLFYKYLSAFGLGKKTGVDLPGEEKGQLIKEENLIPLDLATMSIGQSIGVTPLQMVDAMSAVVNGGYLVRPHLLKEIRTAEGETLLEVGTQIRAQPISEATSAQMRQLLEDVVAKGTGKQAYIPGYRVGGKTGTAQKPGPNGYLPGKYVASFLGFAPADDPQIVGIVVLDEPQGRYQGGEVAAPVFKEVMEKALLYLNIPPQQEIEE